MTLIYGGIDEAGYGPLLGPLCVGCSVFKVQGWCEGDPAPDLWKSLASAVCRAATDKRRRIAVDDSKKLKLANTSVRLRPLHHLERGVLAFLACMQEEAKCPVSDTEFLTSVGVAPLRQAWYAGEPLGFPTGPTVDEAAIAANTLRRALAGSGVDVLRLRAEAVCESTFNELAEVAGTKAAVTESVLLRFLADAWNLIESLDPREPIAMRIVCDRQGGRTQYAPMLKRAFPDAQVRIVGESADQSAYDVWANGPDGERFMRVSFKVEAESDHLPVALASMLAKLTRELHMARFNRYWSSRIPELKPTAGYSFDARRWLQDAAPGLTPAEREELVRRA